MQVISLSWSSFKTIATSKPRIRIVSRGDVGSEFYYVSYADAGGLFETSVLQDAGADQTDLETNYLPYANKNADQPTDTDGASLARTKLTTLGWTIQSHSFTFKTSTVGSIYDKKIDGSDFGFSTMSFYEGAVGSETLITGANATDQTYLTANCTKTLIAWEPTWDYDIFRGNMRFYDTVTDDVRLWAMAVPDVPAYLGGSKELITGSRNLRFVKPGTAISLDGAIPKHLTYSATYHTNKILLATRHPVGYALDLETEIVLYKA